MFMSFFIVIEADGTVESTLHRPEEAEGRFIRSLPIEWADFSVQTCRTRIASGDRAGAEALLDLYSKPL